LPPREHRTARKKTQKKENKERESSAVRCHREGSEEEERGEEGEEALFLPENIEKQDDQPLNINTSKKYFSRAACLQELYLSDPVNCPSGRKMALSPYDTTTSHQRIQCSPEPPKPFSTAQTHS